MAKIGNNTNDLKQIKNDLNIFLNDYITENLNIKNNADVDELIITKGDRFERTKKDITNYLYKNDVFKNDFDFSLSHSLRHNNDFTIESDLKSVFDKVYADKIKEIKEQKRAFKNILINRYLSDRIAEELHALIDYTQKRYKMTAYEAIETINADNVKNGLFEDLQEDLEAFTDNNLNYDEIKETFNTEFTKQIKNIKQQTPKATKSKKEDTKLLDVFLLLKKW